MPSTITHEYHYRDMYNLTKKEFKKIYDYDIYQQYSVFAQGHDALFFSNFWEIHKFMKKREMAIYLQDHKFQEFCSEFAELIIKRGLNDNKEIKLLLYGYIAHHILDSYIHPYIIYETEAVLGKHELVESYIDKYFIEERENKDANTYPIHKMIPKLPHIDKSIINTIDDVFYNVYGYENFGKNYIDALKQVRTFLYLFRYDRLKIKDLGYRLIDKLDLISLKFSFLSYGHVYEDLEDIFNVEKNIWYNPCIADKGSLSNDSLFELYEMATKEAADIISNLEIAINDNSNKLQLKGIIPNVSAIHGLECDLNLSFKTLKKEL